MKFSNVSKLSEAQKNDITIQYNQACNKAKGHCTMTIDIETLPGSDFPEKGSSYEKWHKEGLSLIKARVFCIGVGIDDDTPIIIAGPSEKNVIARFQDLCKKYSSIKFVGHNLLDFDIPMLLTRAIKYGYQNLANHLFQKKWKGDAHDTMQFDMGMKWGNRVKLDHLCQFYGVASPKQEGEDGKSVAEMYHAGKIHEIYEYCKRDIVSTRECYKIQTFSSDSNPLDEY